ncbi:MAG TPA: hypothetical protein DIW27_09590 [Cytophagales bacterium]|nr:hypothetical protein [Cytophagales bacterium]
MFNFNRIKWDCLHLQPQFIDSSIGRKIVDDVCKLNPNAYTYCSFTLVSFTGSELALGPFGHIYFSADMVIAASI